jgi:hypothetical protein
VFRNLHLGDKLQHANVSLRVPTSHLWVGHVTS